jgi:hypothetical protein
LGNKRIIVLWAFVECFKILIILRKLGLFYS